MLPESFDGQGVGSCNKRCDQRLEEGELFRPGYFGEVGQCKGGFAVGSVNIGKPVS